MILKFDKVFLILSDDGKLIAKGTPRNRYIWHIDEDNKKRLLTYRSKKVAESAFKNNGFLFSDKAREYIRKNYPDLMKLPRNDSMFIAWDNVECLFKAKEFSVEYKSID